MTRTQTQAGHSLGVKGRSERRFIYFFIFLSTFWKHPQLLSPDFLCFYHFFLFFEASKPNTKIKSNKHCGQRKNPSKSEEKQNVNSPQLV